MTASLGGLDTLHLAGSEKVAERRFECGSDQNSGGIARRSKASSVATVNAIDANNAAEPKLARILTDHNGAIDELNSTDELTTSALRKNFETSSLLLILSRKSTLNSEGFSVNS